jgi:HSP20 family protein
MRLIKYDNLWDNSLSEFDCWFDRATSGTTRWPSLFERAPEGSDVRTVRADIYDDADNYYIVAELPGGARSEVKIELENAILTISGERKVKNGDNKQSTRFSRSLTVSDEVDADKVKAKLENGLLNITLPKSEARKPRNIAVK